MGRRRAFSLTELLVVLAILAVLCGLLFPVFASAREKGRAATCLSNVGQLARAALVYAGDNNERLPHSHPWTKALGLTRTRVRRPGGPSNDLIQEAVLSCPDRSLPTWPGGQTLSNDSYGGYALNACQGRISDSDSLSHLVMIAEAAWYVRVKSHGRPDQFDEQAKFTQQAGIVGPDEISASYQEMFFNMKILGPVGAWGSLRHGGRGHYAFSDGHARLVARDEFFVPSRIDPCGIYGTPETGAESRLRFAPLPFRDSRWHGP